MATNKYISFNIAGNGGGGGTGGTMNIVELTKAQYEALTTKDPDALYVITDADVIDLNDYALASALTTLDTATTASLATKADKQNVTARNNNTDTPYYPSWNNQGVITGETAIYRKALQINGSSTGRFYQTVNTNQPSIWAPTSAGTAGQILQSNGSGSPGWSTYKIVFCSQSEYDALTTPDPNSIYFIVSDL